MRIGIDLDNTIVCYEGVFHRAALERGLIPPDLPVDKNAVRDFLNSSSLKDAFTELQGHVYGTRMDLACPYPGAREFMITALAAGHRLFIVSHKTRYPMLGPKHDLHASALAFLQSRKLIGRDAVSPDDVYLEPTREKKVARVAELDCQILIDDLPAVLAAPGLPAGMRAILFDPQWNFESEEFESYRDWAGITAALFAPERKRMLPIERSVMSVAAELAQVAGLARPVTIERLAGGKNNRVYRVILAEGSDVVLKSYHVDPRDDRDRLAAEWAFLNFAWASGVRDVPKPLAWDTIAHAALYTFVSGRRIDAVDVSARHVSAALDFICRLNAGHPPDLVTAAEASFTLRQHIETIERRIARIKTLDDTAPLWRDARQFIGDCLIPAWTRIRARIVQQAHDQSLVADACLEPDQICVSPSDFGFHNALLSDDGKITFLDFEYAGRDDPAKLVCDFFCQPEVPVPLAYYAPFVDGLSTRLGLAKALSTRCALLLDAYRIKWLCIMLNDFQPVDEARRRFAEPEARAERCAQQLEKVAKRIELIRMY